MQILLIGNGFDIEHKLPTQYKDFLEFTKEFLEIINSHKAEEDIEKIVNEERKNFFKRIISSKTSEICIVLERNLKNNVWIKYFLRNQVYMKENWIDFESEISKIIVLLEKAKKAYESQTMFPTEWISCPKEYVFFNKEMFGEEENREIYGITGIVFRENKKRLLEDLNKLIDALEIYLTEYVGTIEIKSYNDDIAKLNPTHVLSFNYTNTYERVYDKGCRNIQYDFIHGQAIRNNPNISNMVLGIDEYFDEEERSKNIEFIEFQKYYQRMQKKTKCEYKEWKDKIVELSKQKKNEKIELYIFGHSLDSTDKDVLLEFLLDDRVITTIFYYDQGAYERGLANLIKIMGVNELSTQMYGKNKTINFIKQAPSRKIHNSEFDIKNDTLKIYRLSKYKDTEICNILHKIEHKILNREVDYFCTQERIISLYDAMIMWGVCSNEQENILLEIAKYLASTDKLLYHRSEEWNDFNYKGEIQCPIKTRRFIDNINKYNKETFQVNVRDIEEATELEIVKNYEHTIDLDEETAKKIIDKLILKIGDEQCDGEYIWKGLCHIAYNNMSIFKEIIKKKICEDIGSIEKVRLNDLYEQCEEMEFYFEQNNVHRDLDWAE